MAASARSGGGFRVVAVIPYASLGVYKQWSASVPKSGRRYIGAAWALWNGRFTPNGESSSYIPLDVRGLVPPSERPGASPVSVPTILSLISAAGQTLSGFTNRVSEALKRGGWRSCGMLVGSEYATYCPPLPPPGSPHFVPASVEGGQFRFA
ncbi:MAG: hypothetical protein ACREB9_09075 [Thermoplasmata archaeon]